MPLPPLPLPPLLPSTLTHLLFLSSLSPLLPIPPPQPARRMLRSASAESSWRWRRRCGESKRSKPNKATILKVPCVLHLYSKCTGPLTFQEFLAGPAEATAAEPSTADEGATRSVTERRTAFADAGASSILLPRSSCPPSPPAPTTHPPPSTSSRRRRLSLALGPLLAHPLCSRHACSRSKLD
jgi:hypothetical protein